MLLADPAVQALLVASNEATLHLAAQLKEAASKLTPLSAAEVETQPSSAKPRWSDDTAMDDDDERAVLACLWPDSDATSADSSESLKKKLAVLENSGYTVVSKRRKSGPHG